MKRARAAIVGLVVLVLVAQALATAPPGQAAYPGPSTPSSTAVATGRIRVYVPLSERSGGAPTSAPSATPVSATDTPVPPTASAAPPTNTAAAAATNSPTQRPTNTATSVPTATLVPTATPPPPTSTPVPSATPIPPTPTPALGWQRSDVVFVFLQGLRSSSANGDTFSGVKASLVARGYSSGQFLDYSYRGSFAYVCADTFQDVDTSYAYLRSALAGRRAMAPGTRFVLVGHSLGGLIGWRALDAAANQGESLNGVVGLVTIDSPLFGVGSGKLSMSDVWHCAGTAERAAEYVYPVLNYFGSLNTNADYYRARWSGVASAMTSAGVVIRTVGNANDCLYYPPVCGAIGFYSDDRWSQYLTGYAVAFATAVDPSWLNIFIPATGISRTHGGLLDSANGHTADIAAYADQAARPR